RSAWRGRAPLFRGEPKRALQMLSHALDVPSRRTAQSPRRLELARTQGSRGGRRSVCGAIKPLAGLRMIVELETRQPEADGSRELQRSVSEQPRVAVRLLSAGEREVRDALRAGEDLDAVEHLRLHLRPLALARERGQLGGEPPDLLDPLRGAEQVDIEGEADVRAGDDRRHHATAVADLLEQLDSPLVVP